MKKIIFNFILLITINSNSSEVYEVEKSDTTLTYTESEEDILKRKIAVELKKFNPEEIDSVSKENIRLYLLAKLDILCAKVKEKYCKSFQEKCYASNVPLGMNDFHVKLAKNNISSKYHSLLDKISSYFELINYFPHQVILTNKYLKKLGLKTSDSYDNFIRSLIII